MRVVLQLLKYPQSTTVLLITGDLLDTFLLACLEHKISSGTSTMLLSSLVANMTAQDARNVSRVSKETAVAGGGEFGREAGGGEFGKAGGGEKRGTKGVKNKGTKLLGVCLGMHLLFNHSEEGNCEGLGLVSGKVKKFNFINKNLKIPHMGWNSINFVKKSKLFSKEEKNQHYYFVHSYYVECNNSEDIAATCSYGNDFTSAVERDNIMGVQFHPEKSHSSGKNFYKKFNLL